jgi:ribokinase
MIVVFGSLNMDLILEVPSLPRPGETVLTPGYVAKPGGKGLNQAVAASRAGASVALYGALGDDGFGRSLRAVLADEGVDGAGVATVADPTGCAMICVDPTGENVIAVASGANLAPKADAVPDARLGPSTTLVVQLEVPVEETGALLRRAKARGVRSILSLAPYTPVPRRMIADASVVLLNELELADLIGGEGLRTDPADRWALGLAAETGTDVVVTLGGAGAIAATPAGDLWSVDALAIDPVDTTGAGDCFAGNLAAALDAGLDLQTALHRAAVAAGIACLALGAQEGLPTAALVDARLADIAAPRKGGGAA